MMGFFWGVHPTSYGMGTGNSYPGIKRPAREPNHLHPSSGEIKNAWSYTSILQIRLHSVVLS